MLVALDYSVLYAHRSFLNFIEIPLKGKPRPGQHRLRVAQPRLSLPLRRVHLAVAYLGDRFPGGSSCSAACSPVSWPWRPGGGRRLRRAIGLPGHHGGGAGGQRAGHRRAWATASPPAAARGPSASTWSPTPSPTSRRQVHRPHRRPRRLGRAAGVAGNGRRSGRRLADGPLRLRRAGGDPIAFAGVPVPGAAADEARRGSGHRRRPWAGRSAPSSACGRSWPSWRRS